MSFMNSELAFIHFIQVIQVIATFRTSQVIGCITDLKYETVTYLKYIRVHAEFGLMAAMDMF